MVALIGNIRNNASMARPRNEKVDEAFVIWAGEADRDDTKTAELVGVPVRTLQYWRSTYAWEQRYISELGPAAELSAIQTRQMLRMAGPAMARRMLAILAEQRPLRNAIGDIILNEGQPIMVYASKDSDAVQAAKVIAILGIGEETPTLGSSPYEARYTVPPEPPPPDPGEEENIGALRNRAVAMLEETVASVNTRATVKGRSRPGRKI